MTLLGFLLCSLLVATAAYRVGRATERADWLLYLHGYYRVRWEDVREIEPSRWLGMVSVEG